MWICFCVRNVCVEHINTVDYLMSEGKKEILDLIPGINRSAIRSSGDEECVWVPDMGTSVEPTKLVCILFTGGK